jgi:hypothetical protein
VLPDLPCLGSEGPGVHASLTGRRRMVRCGAGRREERAAPCTEVASWGRAMPDLSSSPEGRALAARLAEAHQRLAALELPDPAAARLHRQFIAVCDAVKVAGADTEVVERRLAAFLSALERAVGRINGYGSRPDNS